MANKAPDDLQFLKTGIRAHKAASFDKEFISKHGFTLETLLAYTAHRDEQVAFRAAWLLEHTFLKDPSLLPQVYAALMQQVVSCSNWSCIRSFSKMGMLATKPPRLHLAIYEPYDEVWIERCFSWIIRADCPVAVAVNCLDILYYLSDQHHWVREELTVQIHHLLKTPTAALASRAKRILKRIL